MRILVGLVALVLSLAAGYLAAQTITHALASGVPALDGPGAAGLARGVLFAVVMAAVSAGLLWVAARFLGWRSFLGWRKPSSGPDA